MSYRFGNPPPAGITHMRACRQVRYERLNSHARYLLSVAAYVLTDSIRRGAHISAGLAASALESIKRSPAGEPPADPMPADAGREQPKPRGGSDGAVADGMREANAYANKAFDEACQYLDALHVSAIALPDVPDIASLTLPDAPQLDIVRPVSMGVHPDGLVNLQVGDYVLELTAAEAEIVNSLFVEYSALGCDRPPHTPARTPLPPP